MGSVSPSNLEPGRRESIERKTFGYGANARSIQTSHRRDTFPITQSDVKDGALQVFSNGEFTYQLRGIRTKISVLWNFEAPPGAGDTHFSIMRGTKANLIIRRARSRSISRFFIWKRRPAQRMPYWPPTPGARLKSWRSDTGRRDRAGRQGVARDRARESPQRPRSALRAGHRELSALSPRRQIAGLGSAEHDHQIRHDRTGVSIKPTVSVARPSALQRARSRNTAAVRNFPGRKKKARQRCMSNNVSRVSPRQSGRQRSRRRSKGERDIHVINSCKRVVGAGVVGIRPAADETAAPLVTATAGLRLPVMPVRGWWRRCRPTPHRCARVQTAN